MSTQLPLKLQHYTLRRALQLEYSESVRRGMARIFILMCMRFPCGSLVRLVHDDVRARVLAVNPRFPVQLLVIPLEGPGCNRLRRVLYRGVEKTSDPALEVTQ